ncbi:purinergic P2X-like receptor [Saccoglossus kowalevskii]|uniref:Purinergic P2X-like receptor n=1 Tax=Saccoglossus kowalevskii TaxID=10224 RepID=D1LXC4_SACKO|nr:purinergic P2X-like receptor [Saccoglossus kowalevskii]ACY92630.1 purinergic P2X-like receptor [Saccoglossus kowalevskii]
MAPQWCRFVIDAALEYDTPKIVHIKSKKVGIINRLIQLVIISYIVGYVIVYQKGYQEFDDVVSTATTKVKGVSYTNLSNVDPANLTVDDTTPYDRLWDVADYVIPPQMHSSFFVMTNMIITVDQTQGKCPEDPGMFGANCTVDADCHEGEAIVAGNGVATGKCIDNPGYNNTKTCEILAWCPVERDIKPGPRKDKPVLYEAANFTVLIKNSVSFPKFDFQKRNILDSSNASFLRDCRYDSKDADLQFCPIFRLGDIVKEAKVSAGEEVDFGTMGFEGGVMGIFINWDCNLDHAAEECKPHYSFRRLDNPEAKIAQGFNFRFAYKYKINATDEYRTLTKAYGILYEVIVTGQAGKFSVIPLFLNIGSGLALLGLATVLCDIVVLYVLKKREYYKENKYLYVDDLEDVPSENYRNLDKE